MKMFLLILAAFSLFTITLLLATHWAYASIMNFQRLLNREKSDREDASIPDAAKYRMPLELKASAYLQLYLLGLPLDFLLNMMATVLTLGDPPQELLFTPRCERYLKLGYDAEREGHRLSWWERYHVAFGRYFCRRWMNDLEDDGCHCKDPAHVVPGG